MAVKKGEKGGWKRGGGERGGGWRREGEGRKERKETREGKIRTKRMKDTL